MSTTRRVIAGAIALVVLGVAVTSVALWRANDRIADGRDPGSACPLTVRARGRPFLAVPGVHRVLLIGDSIMVQASCAIGESLAGLGVTTARRAVPGSGLLTGIDWIATVKPLLADEHPDVVVAIFVGNYLGAPVRDRAGHVIRANTRRFRRAWQVRAELLSRVVRSTGTDMYWVSPPPFAGPQFRDAARLYAGYRSIAGDHVIDAGPSLADAHGHAVDRLRTCGRVRVVRTADAVHLTDDGARIYGQTIARDLGAQLGLRTSPKPC